MKLVMPRPLSPGHFKCIGSRGFGDPFNSYAHSCAWFEGRVFIGTSRYTMPLWGLPRFGRDMSQTLTPFPVPKIEYENMDLRGQIWRYDPADGQWVLVYRSPWENETDRVPLSLAFRSMCVFQGADESKPALYAFPTQGIKPLRRTMLRSVDGETFEEIPQPILEGEYGKYRTFRSLTAFKGRLFAAPSGLQANFYKVGTSGRQLSSGTAANVAQGASIRSSAEPSIGNWVQSSLPDMGDVTNNNLYDFGVCGDYLYVGTLNVREGFQLWRSLGEGPGPHHWEKVLDRGADRGPLNQMTISFAEFRGSLYLGTAIQNGGYDKANNIGPAGAEVIRVHPDGTWDLVVGEARHTRQGFKAPTSGLGPGFGSNLNGYIWRLTVHDDVLYAGTSKIASLLPYLDRSKYAHDPAALEQMLESRGGAELWRSTDGDTWVPITINGFDNRYNGGFRSILSTPVGLFVGTVNLYGSHTAQLHPDGWRYDENLRGGVEVWLGSATNRPSALEVPPVTAPPRIATLNDGAVTEALAIERAVNSSGGGSRLSPELELLCQGAIDDIPIEEMTDTLLNSESLDPFERLARIDTDLETAGNSVDEELLQYFQNSRLRNVGYWQKGTASPREAALSLISELTAKTLSQVPAELRISALVLGPNSAFVAAALMRMRKNIDVTLLADNRRRAKELHAEEPRARVLHSRNADIPVPDQSFDLILDVESPQLLGGPKLTRELVRVGRPGCGVAAAHILVPPEGDTVSISNHLVERTKTLTQAGLNSVLVVDGMDRCWRPFFNHSRAYFRSRFLFDVYSNDSLNSIFDALPGGRQAVATYLLVYASLPRSAHVSSLNENQLI